MLASNDPTALAKIVIKQGLSVRQTERLANNVRTSRTSTQGKSADTRQLEVELSHLLGLKVTISGEGERGEVRVAYENLTQLGALLTKLRKQKLLSVSPSF